MFFLCPKESRGERGVGAEKRVDGLRGVQACAVRGHKDSGPE